MGKAVAEEEEKKIMMERRIEQEEKRLQRSLDRRKLDNARKKIVGHADSMVTFEMPQELYALKNIFGKIGDQTQDTGATSISTSISSSSSSTSISSTSSSPRPLVQRQRCFIAIQRCVPKPCGSLLPASCVVSFMKMDMVGFIDL